ncbi:MAG: indole-3-glycerol phosphate synthase TrpC [Oscillospiraceae bacterium]|nr:indole-3-glycerol phosphate synthase TrpC [Oscillospiraceae bacterium]
MNILEEIAEKTKERIEKRKQERPLDKLFETMDYSEDGCRARGLRTDTWGKEFEKALTRNKINFICEIKKASPSKGVICENFAPVKIAEEYVEAGADAISVLTEPYYFQGDDKYLCDIIENQIYIPALRKDFIVDKYMIYEAKIFCANAVLLICAILDDKQLTQYIRIADRIGLAALVETHDETEVKRALDCGAEIIGVNNRDLKTFNVDISTSEKLRKYIPDDKIFVSESGIKTREDVKRLEETGVNAVLIGETLMRSNNKKAELKKLRGE